MILYSRFASLLMALFLLAGLTLVLAQLGCYSASGYYNRGWDYDLKGDYDNAIANYTKAIEQKPNYAEAYFKRGRAYWMKNDYDSAITDYTKAIEQKPDYAEAYSDRVRST